LIEGEFVDDDSELKRGSELAPRTYIESLRRTDSESSIDKAYNMPRLQNKASNEPKHVKPLYEAVPRY
jgi:hypothetical protein